MLLFLVDAPIVKTDIVNGSVVEGTEFFVSCLYAANPPNITQVTWYVGFMLGSSANHRCRRKDNRLPCTENPQMCILVVESRL
jgi:hypothetical protein